ncbi:hypothetical protein ACYATP_08060 [Lactobacillaceae bacterium Melli_B4]
MDQNNGNEPETREERYKNYRQDIADNEVPGNNGSNYRPNPPKKKRHYGRWIALALAILVVIGIFSIVHQVNELSDTQRQTDTTLDKIIKNQGEQIAKQKVPQEVRPQVIKIIEQVPLSELQRAANDESLFNQIATQNQIPQRYITEGQNEWFKPNNQEMREAIEEGNVLKALSSLKQLGNNNNDQSTSPATSSN